MGNVIINDGSLHDIGNAIRERFDTLDTFTPAEMSDAIKNMPFGERAEFWAYTEKAINLSADTTFDTASISATTTATIRPAQTNELQLDFDSIDLDKYDVLTVCTTDFVPVYKSGDILPRLIKQRSATITRWMRLLRPNNEPTDKDSAVKVGLYFPDNTVASYVYLNTSGAISWVSSISNNSIIATSGRASIWTSNNPISGATNSTSNRYAMAAKWSPSAVTVRASTSQFSVEAMRDLDSKKCEIVRKMYVYRTPIEDRNIAEQIAQMNIMFDELPR